jgi:hypothetical protein
MMREDTHHGVWKRLFSVVFRIPLKSARILVVYINDALNNFPVSLTQSPA